MKKHAPTLDDIIRELQNIRLEISGIKPETVESIIAGSVAALVVELETQKIIHSTTFADTFFGYLQGELTGKPLNTIIPDRFHEKHDSHFEGYSKNPTPRAMGEVNMELLAKHKDGHEIKVEVSLHPLNKRFVIATILKAPW